MRAIKNSSLS